MTRWQYVFVTTELADDLSMQYNNVKMTENVRGILEFGW